MVSVFSVTLLVSIILVTEAKVKKSDTGVKSSKFRGVNYLYFDERKTAIEAQEQCEKCGGNLASVKNQDVQTHIANNLKKFPSCKLGRQAGFFIGLFERSDGDWGWRDNTKLHEGNYTNWENYMKVGNVQSVARAKTGYVEIKCSRTDYAKWKKVSANMRYFICETQAPNCVPKSNTKRNKGSKQNMDEPAPTDAYDYDQYDINPEYESVTMSATDNASTSPATSTVELTTSTSLLIKEQETSSTPGKQTAFMPQSEAESDETAEQLNSLLSCFTSKFLPASEFPNLGQCQSRFNLESGINLVQAFEHMVAKPAAQTMMDRNEENKMSVSAPGIQMNLIKVTNMRKSLPILNVSYSTEVSENSSSSVEINLDDFEQGQSVFVSSVFERKILEKSGVLDLYPAKDLEDYLLSDALLNEQNVKLIPKSSPVMSVSLFASGDGDNKNVVYKSGPVAMKYNIRGYQPIKMVQESGRTVREVSRYCVFLNLTTNEWSPDGCTTLFENGGNVVCKCTHTTTFAVMVSITSFKIPPWLDTLISIVQIVGIAFLFLTLVALLWLRKSLRKDRVLTQINLTLALLLLHLFFIVGDAVKSTARFCEATTFFSHLFLVSSAMWMLNEGVVLYKKTCSDALNFDISKLRLKLIASGWLVPICYVTLCIALGIGLEKYIDISLGYQEVIDSLGYHAELLDSTSKYERCWLSTRSYMILGAAIPVALCLVINMLILVRVSRVIWSMSVEAKKNVPSGPEGSDKLDYSHARATFKAVALLLPILGIPWILAYFANIPGAEIVFVGIHGVISGLQGFFLFVIYIACNRDFRGNMKRRFDRSSLSQTLHLSTITSTSSGNVNRKKQQSTREKEDTTRETKFSGEHPI